MSSSCISGEPHWAEAAAIDCGACAGLDGVATYNAARASWVNSHLELECSSLLLYASACRRVAIAKGP